MKLNVACFIGNRTQRLPFIFSETNSESILIKQKLEEEIKKAISNGYTHFISSLQLGIELWAAEMVQRVKMFYPEIILEAILPYENQASFWAENYRDIYFNILADCDYVSHICKHYLPSCNLLATEYMVNKSSLIIAVSDGKDNEIIDTLKYAKTNGLELILIDITKKSVD